MAVDLVNTRDPIDGIDELQSVDDLKAFLSGYERDWHAEDWHPGSPDTKDVKAARRLRERPMMSKPPSV